MSRPPAGELDSMWQHHGGQWRDPTATLSPWGDDEFDARLLRTRVSGAWWETLERLGATLLVTREYEHLVMALTVADGRPRVSYLPLPHPSGLAVDRRRGVVSVASTRNPNQVYELEPVTSALVRGEARTPELDARPLLPMRSTIHPGALYIHDLAYIGGELHANSVGQNAVVRLPTGGGHEIVWWPRAVERDGRADLSRNWIQLNSIGAGKDLASSYFSASSDSISARRPGHRNYPVDRRGVIFSGATREPVARGLTRPHSVRLRRGQVWVDNSGYGELGVARDGGFEPICRLPGWTRGLSFCRDVAFVGTSRVIPRFSQYAPGLDVERSRCALHAVDCSSGELLGSLTWPYGNQIFAIDWLERSQSMGLPALGARGHAGSLTDLFYSFDNPRRRTRK
ncbi:MAG: DUF4915 domain-containing protein [Solirubrobacterales bacterium]